MTYQIKLEVINQTAGWTRTRDLVCKDKGMLVEAAKVYVVRLEGHLKNLAIETVSETLEVWTVIE